MKKVFSDASKAAGQRFISSIYSGELKVDKRPNHGDDFMGGYEQLHKMLFKNYLASSSRYLNNKRCEEVKYFG